MKILVIATTFPRWQKDKEATFVLELSKELMKNGLDVSVLVPDSKGAKKCEVYEGLKVYRFSYFFPRGMQKLAYGGILPNIKKNPFLLLEVPFFVLFEFLNAMKIIKKEKIDIVHSHWIIPQGFIGAILKKLFGVKHVVTIHAGGIFALNRFPLKRQIANFIVNNSDVITAVSGLGKKNLDKIVSTKLKKQTENKTKVIPMGIYTNKFKLGISKNVLKKKYGIESKHAVLFIGRIAEKKGLEYLIRAINLIRKNINDVMLIVVGDGPLRTHLEKLSENLGLEKHINFVGYKVGNDKISYLSLSDLVVVPSIVTASGDTEGLPVTVMEAMAAGKPVIASDVGGMNEIITNNVDGILVKQKNVKQLAESISLLFRDIQLCDKLSRNALLTSKNYDWSEIGKRYYSVIKD